MPLNLPGGATLALSHGAQESVAVTAAAYNANGVTTAHTTIPRL